MYVTYTSVCKLLVFSLLAKLKHLTRLSLENGIRQTWFHLYVSESVKNQIRMHILLYYVCHAVQFTETAWKLNGHCKVNILILIKVS